MPEALWFTEDEAACRRIGEYGAAVARVLIDAPACPAITINQRSQPMTLRAPAGTIALRPTPSAPADSKPAEFPLLTCEAPLPAGATSASVLGHRLPLPKAASSAVFPVISTFR